MSEDETLEAVFWRLVQAGMPADEIGRHPDYRAAFERERPWPYDLPRPTDQ